MGKCLLSINYVPGYVLYVENTVINEVHKIPALLELTLLFLVLPPAKLVETFHLFTILLMFVLSGLPFSPMLKSNCHIQCPNPVSFIVSCVVPSLSH